jgi:hypothetical protein
MAGLTDGLSNVDKVANEIGESQDVLAVLSSSAQNGEISDPSLFPLASEYA